MAPNVLESRFDYINTVMNDNVNRTAVSRNMVSPSAAVSPSCVSLSCVSPSAAVSRNSVSTSAAASRKMVSAAVSPSVVVDSPNVVVPPSVDDDVRVPRQLHGDAKKHTKARTKAHTEARTEARRRMAKRHLRDTPVFSKCVKLGDRTFVSIRTYRKDPRVNIRDYVSDEHGGSHALKRGILLTSEQWNVLKKNIHRIDCALELRKQLLD